MVFADQQISPETVDFPTPPFPEAIMIIFLTPRMGVRLGRFLLIKSLWLPADVVEEQLEN